VRRILSDYVELQAIATRRQVQTLAENTRCPVTKPKLEALAAEANGSADLYRAEVYSKRKSVIDLLEEFPACELPFALYLEMLPQLSPRYYSISSGPSATPTRCAITVGVVEGPARSGNGTYRGTCSNHLLPKGEGDVVHASVKETKAGFRMPEDPSVPLIMIGPGTGLAPFRGFLQEREAQAAAGMRLGKAMLFFGCRNAEQDFIYRDELRTMADKGLVDLHVAFSRPESGDKTYVQDLVRKERAKVWDLISQGAKIFVCGDGSRMEPDVKRAVSRIWAEEMDKDADAADAWIDQMGKSDRYVLDVWAGS
jgi:cytochrome P450/NADPH-cytochrome P450 reductase